MPVALRKESVDRNYKFLVFDCIQGRVALRKESVNRNFRNVYDFPVCVVALRKESVDRNINCIVPHAVKIWSLSARRAWIEIPFLLTASSTLSVALRKESVDRNFWLFLHLCLFQHCRSPQGERG